MRAIVVGEYRLFRGPDGHVYAESVFGHDFWQRYLDVFDGVVVVARVGDVSDISAMLRVDGPRVEVHSMPYYVGMADYFRNAVRLRRAAAEVGRMPGAMILRVPGAVASAVQARMPRRRPFALEVVGDPMDVFAPGVVEPPLRRLVRWRAVRRLRRLARCASAVAYVSEHRLAERYPAARGAPTFVYSSASLPEHAFAAAPRVYSKRLQRIIAIGSMEQMYKGFDVLIRALPELRERVPGLRVTIAGGGRHAGELATLADELSVGEIVRFAGIVRDPADLRGLIDESDLFVSASRTEGLPRTVLEAQARGLACVGTNVGATVELLETSSLCQPGDVDALAKLVAATMANPESATASARVGWTRSRRYGEAALRQKRNLMYGFLRETCERR